MNSNCFASFYEFARVTQAERVKRVILAKCVEKQILGTVILSQEGINGSLVGNPESLDCLLKSLTDEHGFRHLLVNRSEITTSPFDRLVVRIKGEIVTSGFENLVSSDSNYIEPEHWDHFIRKDDVITVDVRNFYEHSIGSFTNSIRPKIRRFRQFPDFVQQKLIGKKDKKIAIFCTGGIRCEKASELLASFGFQKIFQLRGGILNYFKNRDKTKIGLWRGDCFVFDKRLAIDSNFRTLNYEQCPKCKQMVSKKNQPVDEIEWAPCPDCNTQDRSVDKNVLAEGIKCRVE